MPGVLPYLARRIPLWIRAALDLPESQVPAVLVSTRTADGGILAPVQATVDAFQGGHGVAQPILLDDALLTNATPFLLLGTDPDANYGYLICALSWTANMLGATRNIALTLRPVQPAFAAGGGMFAAIAATPTNATIAFKDIFGGATPYFVPPGFSPALLSNGLQSGESLTVQSLVLKIPAGFKPF